jgi:ubiquinone/menaquinone biosynthesis C-methylase UbiE
MSMSEKSISRVTRSKEEARASYDQLSRWYDLLAGRFEQKYQDAGLQKLRVKQGERVLEIGFGTGYALVALAQSVGSSGKVYGIDLSEGMCRVAKARVDNAHLAERVELTCGDAARLPYVAESFDVVYMSFTLELFDTPEVPIVLGECRRVLRAGGRLGVVAMSKRGRDTLMTRLYEWAHRSFPRYVDCRPIFVRQALEDAGFYVGDVTAMSMWGLPVDIVVASKGV